MQTIDEISIGREGDMFTLTIYHYGIGGGSTFTKSTTFLIGLPDQFHAETQRTIGQYLTRAVEAQAREGRTVSVPDGDWPYNPDALTHDAQGAND